MKVLVLYGTTEGQTRKIADFVTTKLKQRGDIVTMIDAADVPWDLRPKDYDAAILAGSLHAGVYQTPLIHFARKFHETLNKMPTAFFSVSLSAAGKDADDLKGVAVCADLFVKETGWKPGEINHIAGAFKFADYDFFKRWMMKVIAWERGITIGGAAELELTDWDALAKTAEQFHERASKAKPATAA